MKKRVSYRFVTLLCLVYCFMTLAGTCFAADKQVNVTAVPSDEIHETDLFLVLDNSGSMEDSDPERLLESFANDFFHGAPVGTSTVGALTFTKGIDKITNPVTCDGTRDSLGDLGYTQQKGAKTYIANALDAAASMLEGTDKNPNKAIILVTDGEDKAGVDYEAKAVNGKTIPVYCIFINDGKVENERICRDYLQKIADDTGTKTVYEVKTTKDIGNIVPEIVADIFNYKQEDYDVVVDDECDVLCTVGDDIYEMIGTIEYTDQLVLTITSPSGVLLYDNGTSYSNMLHVTNDHSPATINLLWPEAGDYVLHLSNEEQKHYKISLVEISAGMNLTLSDSKIRKGAVLQANCSLIGNADGSVENTVFRVFDDRDTTVLDSEAGTAITANQQGGYDIDTQSLEPANYNVVAISTLSNGHQYASVKVPLEVTNRQFPWHLVIIGGVIVLLILAILIFMSIRGKRPAMVRPEHCRIRVKLFSRDGGKWEQVSMVDLPMPASLPDGKKRDMYQLIDHENRMRSVEVDSLPPQLKTMNLSYWIEQRSKPNENGYFLVEVGHGKEMETETLTSNSGLYSYVFGNNIRIDLKYSN